MFYTKRRTDAKDKLIKWICQGELQVIQAFIEDAIITPSNADLTNNPNTITNHALYKEYS